MDTAIKEIDVNDEINDVLNDEEELNDDINNDLEDNSEEGSEEDEDLDNESEEESEDDEDQEESEEDDSNDKENDIKESKEFKEAVNAQVQKILKERLPRTEQKQKRLERDIKNLKSNYEQEIQELEKEKTMLNLALKNGLKAEHLKFISGDSEEELQTNITEFLDTIKSSNAKKRVNDIDDVFESKQKNTIQSDPFSAALLNEYM